MTDCPSQSWRMADLDSCPGTGHTKTVANRESPPVGAVEVFEPFGDISEMVDGKPFPRWVEVRVFAGPDPDDAFDERARANHPVIVDVRFEVAAGRRETVSVRLTRMPGGPPVTNSTFRSISADKLADLAAEAVGIKLWMRSAGPGSAIFTSTLIPPAAGRHRPVTEELLRQ